MVATLYVYAALFLQSQSGTSWDLRSMWASMSALPRVVVGILFVLSVYSFGVMIDRALMYSAARKQSRVFVQQVAGALKDGKLDEAISALSRSVELQLSAQGYLELGRTLAQAGRVPEALGTPRGAGQGSQLVHGSRL